MEQFSPRTTFAERIEECIRMSGGNVSAFAARVGLTPPAISKYRKGSLPELDTLVNIARAAGVSIEWLATGGGSVAVQIPASPGAPLPPDPVFIPLLIGSSPNSTPPRALQFAGTAAIATRTMAEAIFEDANLGSLAVCQIDDSSLRPEMRKRAWIFVDTSKRTLFAGLGVFRIRTQLVVRVMNVVEAEPGQSLKFQLTLPFYMDAAPTFIISDDKLGGDIDLLGEVVSTSRQRREKA